MSQRTFLGAGSGSMVLPTWTLLTFDSSQAMQSDATICCFARERVDRD